MKIDLIKIGERIKTVRGDQSGEKFGAQIGVSTNMVSMYENGAAWPKAQTLAKIIKISGKSADWLLFGTPEADLVVAENEPEYTVTMPVRALAGAGDPCCIDQLNPIGQITVSKDYDGPNIQVIQIRGNSMEPTYMDGAHVGVDITSREVISGQAYAVYIPHEGIVVKRIWIGPELVTIASDNPSAPSHEVMADRVNWDTFIQGRVKWVIQKLY
jgi:phage repressor protein C with HTH and peptisase S24 domain